MLQSAECHLYQPLWRVPDPWPCITLQACAPKQYRHSEHIYTIASPRRTQDFNWITAFTTVPTTCLQEKSPGYLQKEARALRHYYGD